MSATTQKPNSKPVKLDPEEELGEGRTLWGDVWKQFRKHRAAMIAVGVLFSIILMVTFGPSVWTTSPEDPFVGPPYSGLTAQNPMGTDDIGRDTFARVLYGGRVSLMIGVSAMLVAMSLGTLIGVLSGFYKTLDGPLMRLTDMFLALPLLPLLLVITMLFRDSLRGIFGPELGIFILTVTIIGALGWMPTARLVRGEVLSVKEREFVLAARSVGASDGRILRKHVLPNVFSPVIVAATFSIASAIITESALSFLGLGFPPDFPTWGRLLQDGQKLITAPNGHYLVIFPGVLISISVLCVNFIGDGLRDALDPRLRK